MADRELSKEIEKLKEPENAGESTSGGFRLIEGVLYRQGGVGCRRWRLAVPSTLRYDITRSCHDDPTSGHEGQEKTYLRVFNWFWWPNMRSYVREYVARCAFCQARKVPR